MEKQDYLSFQSSRVNGRTPKTARINTDLIQYKYLATDSKYWVNYTLNSWHGPGRSRNTYLLQKTPLNKLINKTTTL